MGISDQIQAELPTVITGLGSLGGGMLITKVLAHLRSKRKQTDDVALLLVERLSARVQTLEASQVHEREICDARLATMRHELANVAANFDGLLLAIKYAPADRISEIVADVLSRRAAAIRPIPAAPADPAPLPAAEAA